MGNNQKRFCKYSISKQRKMKKLIIGITGKIHSGKSTLAKKISHNLDIPIVSFGGYLKEFSLQNNLPTDRDSLQNLGNNRILDNPELFIDNVLTSHSDTQIIIVEGIRHYKVLQYLDQIYTQSLFIFLNVPFDERYDRYINNEIFKLKNLSKEEFYKIDNHEVECEINSLEEKCEIVLNSEYQINDLLEKIKTKISHSTL